MKTVIDLGNLCLYQATREILLLVTSAVGFSEGLTNTLANSAELYSCTTAIAVQYNIHM